MQPKTLTMLDPVLLSKVWEFKGWVKNGVMNKFHSAGHQTGEEDNGVNILSL